MRSNLNIARNHVQTLRRALLSPSHEEIERCLPLLADAVGCISAIQRDLASQSNQDAELRRDLKSLRQELNAVNKLIEHGAAFWRGWARLLGSATSGYTPSGEARPVAVAGTISLRG
jgi:hypothetical protein